MPGRAQHTYLAAKAPCFVTERLEPHMRKSLAEQGPLAAGHVSDDGIAGGLGRREPGQLESVLLRFAVPVDRNDVGQGHGMLTRIVKRRDSRRGEVLRDREWRRRGRDTWQCKRTEVLLDVAEQGRPHPFVVEHSSRYQGS